MIKRFAYLFLLLFITYHLSWAQEWVRQAPFPVVTLIEDIAIDPSGNGWAVGEELVLKTENDGSAWQIQDFPVPDPILEYVEILPGTNGQTAFTGNTQLYRTTDGGMTWDSIRTPATFPVRQIEVASSQTIYLVTNQLAKSSDGGATWSMLSKPVNGTVNSLNFISENEGWIGIANQVYYTVDGGDNWTLKNGTPTTATIDFLRFANSNTGYLLDSDRIVHKTTDGGTTWSAITTDEIRFSTRSMEITGTDHIWISYYNLVREAIYSKDGGMTWEEVRFDNPSARMHGLFVQDENNIWIGGQLTTIIRTKDGGQTWTDEIPGNKQNLQAIEFVDNDYGLAVGFGGAILRTEDGGAIWEDVTISPSSGRGLEDIFLLDRNNSWITGRQTLFSSDQGKTWTDMNQGRGYSIYAISPDRVLIGKSNGTIMLSTDGGSNFTEVFNSGLSGVDIIYDIDFIDSQKGFATSSSGYLLQTTDGGATWTERSDVSSSGFKAIHLLGQKGWLTYTRNKDSLLYTTDGGNNWNTVLLPQSYFYTDVEFINDNEGWLLGYVGSFGKIFSTTDGGLTWEEEYASVSAGLLGLSIPSSSDPEIWVTGFGGTILNRGSCSAVPNLLGLSGDEMPCPGDTITYTVNSENVNEFFWTIPSGSSIFGNSNTAQIQLIIGDQAGQLSIQGSNTCTNSNTLSLMIDPLMAPDAPVISINGQTLSTTINATAYQWSRNGIPISGATSNTYLATESGTYTLKVSNGTCFSAASNEIEVIITSTHSIEAVGGKLYPNPSTGNLILEFPPTFNGKISVNLRNQYGQLVANYRSDTGMKREFDLRDLPAGLYYLSITNNDGKTYLARWMRID